MISIGVYATIFLGFMTLAAWSDARDLRISNKLTGMMAASGLAGVGLLDGSATALLVAGATGAATLTIVWVLFEFGWLGGGDVKLAGAAAIWLGPEATLAFVLATTIFGAVLALALLMLTRWDMMLGMVGSHWRTRLTADTISVPYALAMAPAGVVAMLARFPDLF